MAGENLQGYISYRVSGLPTGPFGETYVIASATLGSNGIHSAEYFIISKRHDPHLVCDQFNFNSRAVPNDVLNVDEEYLFSEVRQQATNYLNDVLFQLAETHGHHILVRYNAELVEIKHMPLGTVWIHR